MQWIHPKSQKLELLKTFVPREKPWNLTWNPGGHAPFSSSEAFAVVEGSISHGHKYIASAFKISTPGLDLRLMRRRFSMAQQLSLGML